MHLLQAGVLLTGICWLESADVPPPACAKPLAAEQVRELIAQLGANEFRKREQASATLEQQGDEVLPVLRQTLAATGDLEVRVRVERLIVVIETRNRARNALQQIFRRAQQSKEPPDEQQLVYMLYLLTLGRPATADERERGEKQLKAAKQRETTLAEMIDQLQQHAEYSKPLAEARLQVQDFRVEMAREGESALMRVLQGGRGVEKVPIQKASQVILDIARPLEERAAIDLLFLMTIARLPAAKEYAQVEKHLKSPKPVARQALFQDLWWALLNTNEFIGAQPRP